MIKYTTMPINEHTTKAKYVVDHNGKRKSFHEKISDARQAALLTLQTHPGYMVEIFVIEKKEDVTGFYKMKLKQISSLKF